MNTPTRIAAKLSFSHLDQESRAELPPTSVLLIEKSESGVLLIRFAADGRFAGDTWHPSADEAKEQALFECGLPMLAWKEVPADINDIVAFMDSA